jgi:hypothetical protein
VRCDFQEIEKLGLNNVSDSVDSLTLEYRSQTLTLLPFDERDAEWRSIASIVAALREEEAAPQRHPGRPWSYAPAGAEFTFVEQLRANLDGEAAEKYNKVERLGEPLAASLRRSAFAGVGLDDKGSSLTPWWVSVRDVALHASGNVSAAGSPSHALFFLPDALDHGAWDGRNMSQWCGMAPQGLVWPNNHLYLGEASTSRFEMLRVAGNVTGIDVSRDGHARVRRKLGRGVGRCRTGRCDDRRTQVPERAR